MTSPTSGGRSVGIVRLRTQTTVFSFYVTLNMQRAGKKIPNKLLHNGSCISTVISFLSASLAKRSVREGDFSACEIKRK
jgi:hypothetical protein